MAARKLPGLTLPGRAGTCKPRSPEAFAIFCPFDSLSITTTTIIPPFPPSTSTRHLFAHLHTRCHQPRKLGWTFSFRSGRSCCLRPRRLCRLTVCSRNKIFCTHSSSQASTSFLRHQLLIGTSFLYSTAWSSFPAECPSIPLGQVVSIPPSLSLPPSTLRIEQPYKTANTTIGNTHHGMLPCRPTPALRVPSSVRR